MDMKIKVLKNWEEKFVPSGSLGKKVALKKISEKCLNLLLK